MTTDFTYTRAETLLKVSNLCVDYSLPILKDVNFEVRDIKRPGITQGQKIALLAPSGGGKCLAKGTKIIMFDGSVSNVEDIRVGDTLMGPDSEPRRVLSLGRGRAMMYDIVPTKGAPHRVNGDHIMSVQLTRDKSGHSPTINISVLDYLKTNRTFKARAKLYRVGVQFASKEVPLDPYLFGIWLGDGDTNTPGITTADPEIAAHIIRFAKQNLIELRIRPNGIGNAAQRYILSAKWNRKKSIKSVLRRMGVLGKKHIPRTYLVNDESVRLQVLAGIVDADGYLGHCCYNIAQKSDALANDIVFLARSLGFAAYLSRANKTCTNNGKVGIYNRISISGDIARIPTKLSRRRAPQRQQIKDWRRVGFVVKATREEPYFGFELDGDGLFLLSDFTVTHNTTLFKRIAGLEPPSSGSVLVGTEQVPVKAGMVGLVPQNYLLFSHRTVGESLTIAASMREKDRAKAKAKVVAELEDFGLSDKWHAYPQQLSGGQRQRVSIAEQLLSSNHFVLMDEPFSGLDVLTKKKVCEIIDQVAARDDLNTIIFSTHDIESAVMIADTILPLGRDRDQNGHPIPGAHIKNPIDLIERGLAWHQDIEHMPGFAETVAEIKALFPTL